MGKRFEKFIRDHLGFFFKDFREARRWWFRDVEIDIVSKNSEKKEILIGECEWSAGIHAKTLLKELAEKAKSVGWQQGERKEIPAAERLDVRKIKEELEQEGKKVVVFEEIREVEDFLKGLDYTGENVVVILSNGSFDGLPGFVRDLKQ